MRRKAEKDQRGPDTPGWRASCVVGPTERMMDTSAIWPTLRAGRKGVIGRELLLARAAARYGAQVQLVLLLDRGLVLRMWDSKQFRTCGFCRVSNGNS